MLLRGVRDRAGAGLEALGQKAHVAPGDGVDRQARQRTKKKQRQTRENAGGFTHRAKVQATEPCHTLSCSFQNVHIKAKFGQIIIMYRCAPALI